MAKDYNYHYSPKTKSHNKSQSSYYYRPVRTLKSQEVKAYRITALIILLIFIFLLGLYFFGIYFVGNLSTFWETIRGENQDQNQTQSSEDLPLQTPKLNSLPSYTNQKQMTISGSINKKSQIELFLNDNSIAQAETDEKGIFSFEQVNLNDGENEIWVQAQEGENESEISSKVKITLDQTPPDLEVLTPQENQEFEFDKTSCEVTGKTDSQALVFINDHQVIVLNDGTFSYTITLQKGKNTLKIKAQDKADNQKTVERTVTLKEEEKTQTTPN